MKGYQEARNQLIGVSKHPWMFVQTLLMIQAIFPEYGNPRRTKVQNKDIHREYGRSTDI
jgi:hypothetical protein